MNDQDALMWHVERDPLLRSTMVGAWVLDRAPDPARFERALTNLARAMPRFRQTAEPDPLSIAPPRWEPDPSFDLGFHMARVSGGGTAMVPDVLDLASKVAMQSFDLARPLWRLVVVDGLEGGRAAVILKLHHSVTDAVGFIRVLGHLVQITADEDPATSPEAATGTRLTPATRAVDALVYRLRQAARLIARLRRSALGGARAVLDAPASTLLQLARLAGSMARVFRPAFRPKSQVMSARSLNMRLDTLTFPLDDLRAAAKLGGGKLNDAFLAALAGGLARYHALHGRIPAALRVNMPINFRAADASEGGNYFIPARFLLPLGTADPGQRMREAGRIVTAVRSEPALAKVEPPLAVLNLLPAITRLLFGGIVKGVDVNASNVPGPPIPLYCAGAKILEMYAATPLAGAAVSVSMVSYAGSVYVTINSDRAAVPDPEQLVACLEDGFREVLANVPAATPVPEEAR
jgi:diacylglycerol O-acyltransferase